MSNEHQDDRHDDAAARESEQDVRSASQQAGEANDTQNRDDAREQDTEARGDSEVDAIAIAVIVLILVGLAVFYVSR